MLLLYPCIKVYYDREDSIEQRGWCNLSDYITHTWIGQYANSKLVTDTESHVTLRIHLMYSMHTFHTLSLSYTLACMYAHKIISTNMISFRTWIPYSPYSPFWSIGRRMSLGRLTVSPNFFGDQSSRHRLLFLPTIQMLHKFIKFCNFCK